MSRKQRRTRRKLVAGIAAGSFRQSVWAILAAIVLLTVFVTSGALAANTADSRQAAAQILSSPRYQTKLPGEKPAPGSLPAAAGSSQGKDDSSSPTDSQHQGSADDSNSAPSSLPEQNTSHAASPSVVAALHALPTVLLAVLAVAILVFAYLRFRSRRRATAAEETVPIVPAATPTERAPAPLAAWQKLAEQDRFTEAIHALLLQVLLQLHHERLITTQLSQTSREILNGGSLPPQRRAGLATIIGAVEYCHFGGRPAGAQLFQRCVDAYQQVMSGTTSDVQPA